jgi:ABC-2 type transport system permease protein
MSEPGSSLRELISVRFKEFLREPEAIFWSFGFPILLAIGLGIAFRSRPPEKARVAVAATAPWADTLVAALRVDSGLVVEKISSDSARQALITGRVALVVWPGNAPTMPVYQYDDTRPDARIAALVVNDAIQRGAGRNDPVQVTHREVREAGSRYIDFVVPGLLGMSIMGGGIWGLGFSIVDQRRKKLLKRRSSVSLPHRCRAPSFWRRI